MSPVTDKNAARGRPIHATVILLVVAALVWCLNLLLREPYGALALLAAAIFALAMNRRGPRRP